MHILKYSKEASVFTEALPLGNGRLGAMAYGGVSTEKYSLNDDSFWSGYPRFNEPKDAPSCLERARRLIDAGDYESAQREIEENFTGDFTEAYMPLGRLVITRDLRPDEGSYVRRLDLSTGVHTVSYTSNGVGYTTEAFVSHPAQALVINIKSSRPGSVSFNARLECDLKSENILSDNCIALNAEAPSRAMPSYSAVADPLSYSQIDAERGQRARVVCRCVSSGGRVSFGSSLTVSGADEATLIVCARTSFAGFDKQPFAEGLDEAALCAADVEKLRGADYENLKRAHISDFSEIMERAEFSLDASSEDIDTDELLEQSSGLRADPRLCELLFYYGRYLSASASRPGTQAMNLQGIWNESPVPPWSSNYTININTEMNYYPAEAANMSDLHEPLFDLIDRLVINGKHTARHFYGLEGAVAHHNADVWARTNPVGEKTKGCAVWSHWSMSLGWLCRHYFEHYQYTLDRNFLKNRALPAMREAVSFYVNALRPDERGYLRIYPATSPENCFIYGGKTVAVARASTMSNSIIRELFGNYLSALDILGLDEPLKRAVEDALPRIYPYEIGSKGQLLEWDSEYEEAEPNHRHTSHLYGLHPGKAISPVHTPALAEACRRTLALRGDDGTGWSLSWKICFWARLRDGDHALKLLKNQLRLVREGDTIYSSGGGVYPNLLDAHPPFQIDGNFGTCAGICEMLLQSDPGEITLLPALPGEWKNGGFKGLKAMGCAEVSARFEGNKLRWALIKAGNAEALPISVIYDGRELAKITSTGEHEIYVGR